MHSPSPAARRARLRELIATGQTTAALGATDALSARLIEAHGFETVYIGSYATAASRFALPDTGLLSLDELVAQAKTIVNAVSVPVIADAEGGFNDAPNIWRTVQAFEQAGVAAIHIEDHAFGKHAEVEQRLRPMEEATARIRAAVEAKSDPNFVIAARSDALWVTKDLDDTVRRLSAYAEAGADMVFPTGVGPQELAEIRRRVDKPAMVVDMRAHTLADEIAAGASIVLYYGFSTLVQYDALRNALASFARTRDGASVPGLRDRVAEFEDFMGYGEFAKRAKRYAPK